MSPDPAVLTELRAILDAVCEESAMAESAAPMPLQNVLQVLAGLPGSASHMLIPKNLSPPR